MLYLGYVSLRYVLIYNLKVSFNFHLTFLLLNRGGSRGRVQGVRTTPPPLPRDDLRFSNTTGILQKKRKLCGLLVLK